MSEEVRDLADQPQDPRTGSHYHPEFVEFWHAKPDRSIPWAIVAVVGIAFGIITAIVWRWA